MKYIFALILLSVAYITYAESNKTSVMSIFLTCDPDISLINQYDEIKENNEKNQFLRKAASADIHANGKTDADSVNKSLKKATAIRLIGKTPGTNNIDIIINELAFSDLASKSYPAIDASIDKGEVILSHLWRVVEDANSNSDYFMTINAGMALQKIMGKKEYQAMLNAKKGTIDKQVYQSLLLQEY